MIKDNKKTTAVALKPSQAILEALRNEFPAEQGFTRTYLPRLGMFSQDVMEGKGKAMKVVTEAGTFFTDRQSEEETENAEGKKVKEFVKEEIGDSIEGIIIFQRRQLRHYNESTEEYTSSPIFDFDTDIIPLFLGKKEVARGTAAELKARSEFQVTKEGKTKSTLEENKILYVIYKDEIFQMNLRGSSMYSYKGYAKELHANEQSPSMVLTKFTSEACEKGDIEWNKMIFTVKRDLDGKECKEVYEKVQEIKAGITEEREFFANQNEAKSAEKAKAKKELDEF
jgi:hypothetical protein